VRLSDILCPYLGDRRGSGSIVSLVGAGGKTSAMFALATEFGAAGGSPLVTTTTAIRDPRREKGQSFDSVTIGYSPPAPVCREIHVIAPAEDSRSGKLLGFSSNEIDWLSAFRDLILVEADGARGLSIKAPAGHEPALPPGSRIVLGFVGLDCLGEPLDDRIAHRPELFSLLTGCQLGAKITIAHVLALVASPLGLFKSSPFEACRILILTKADLLSVTSFAATKGGLSVGLSLLDGIAIGSMKEESSDFTLFDTKHARRSW
jgi:probable selenium-dependent hydroxylase accessory protein YqeC